MLDISVNFVGVLIAALAQMAVGFLWYGPLFGKMWMRLSGMGADMMKSPEMKAKAQRGYMVSFLGSLVMAYVLAHFVIYFDVVNWSGAWQLSFWLWLGMIATTQLSPVLWNDKPFKLYLLDALHYLVGIYVMIGVLASWS